MGIFLVIFMYAIWSSVFSFGKMALEVAPPIFLTSFRMCLGGVLLLSFLLLTKREAFRIKKKQFLSLLVLGFFSIYLTNILEFWGLQYLSAAKTCFIYSLSPFFAAFFSYLHFGEKMNGRKWLGLLIGFIGIIPVLTQMTGSEELHSFFYFLTWPQLAVMGAALFAVYGWVLLRLIVKDQEVSPIMANGSAMLMGGMMALVHSFFTESWHPFPVSADNIPYFLRITLLITFISNILCYNLYGVMLKKFTATFLSFMGLLSPIFASLISWIFLGETPSWTIFLSSAIVSCGLWIVYQAELRQGYIKKSAPVIIPTQQ